jgi:hypothetical protein
MNDLSHFFFSFALHRFSAMARAKTKVGKGKSDKGKSNSVGLCDDEVNDGSRKVKSKMAKEVMLMTA